MLQHVSDEVELSNVNHPVERVQFTTPVEDVQSSFHQSFAAVPSLVSQSLCQQRLTVVVALEDVGPTFDEQLTQRCVAEGNGVG